MYLVHDKVRVNGKIESIAILNSFPMGSANRVYKIGGSDIKGIQISSFSLASPMVTDLVMKKYKKLIAFLAELMVDDDDSGESMREALNQIEKFRLEIKNKYRDFLKKKELEMMSKQLMILQKEATERYLEIRNSFIRMDENKRSK